MKTSSLAEILTDKAQLSEYFATAAVPRSQWRTGMECELFLVDEKTLMPISFYGNRGIETILKQMAKSYGWERVYEGDAVIGLNKDGYTVTLEPGGQIELSSSPHIRIMDCIQERVDYIEQLKEIAYPMGIRLMSIGYHPLAALEDVEWVPKQRYHAMSGYFRKRGGYLAHHMMKLTTSVQTSIDYEDEKDFSRKMQLASFLTPVIQAIYANSPFKKGEFSRFLDFRGFCWEHTDNDRCGLFEKAFSGEFGFSDYIDFLLAMPMIVRFEGQQAIPMEGMLFEDFCRSRVLTLEDWHSHVSFAFPEIRLRNYIELRMIDSIPDNLLSTIPALLKGIFYNEAAGDKVLDLFAGISAKEVLAAYKEVHQKALQAKLGGRPVLELARDTVNIAEQGLKSLGQEGLLSSPEEQALLEPLKEQLWEKGMSPAEELLQLWEEKGRNIFNLRDKILL